MYGRKQIYFVSEVLIGNNRFSFCICRLLTETVKQSQDAWGGSSEWREVEVLSDLVFAKYHMDFSLIHV
jgi:hypothetical protein